MRRTFKQFVALAMSIVMVLSLMPMSAFAVYDYAHNEAESSDDYYDIISKTDWDIAPGIKETEIVLNNDAGDRRQVIHLMEADISNPYTRVISSYTNMDTSNYAISTIPEHAAFIENEWGENVVGAMNTCLSWYNSAAYAQDPSRVNEPLGFMMVDSEIYFDHSVGFPTCIVIHKDVNDAGESRPADIPKVEMRTVTDETCLNGWEDQVIPCSSGYIVKDGVNQQKPAHDSNTAARSVVGVKADGSIVIMMNDGRQSPYSLGMNMYECAEVMIAAGCVYAANCDGGGSSTFMSQRPGEELKVNCSPCDGALRQNTHGIIFISTAPATGEFDNAYLKTENDYFVPHSKVAVEAVGRDFSGAEAEIPAEATWALDDASFGSITDGVFTSNGKTGDVTIQMLYNDKVVGSKLIHIVNPESVSFAQNSTVIPYGKSTSLDIVAAYGAFQVSYTEDAFEWTLSDATAGVRENLSYTATSDTTKNGVKITATYKYADMPAAVLDITFGKGSEILYSFEDGDISNWLGIDEAIKWAEKNSPNSPLLDASPLAGQYTSENSSTTFLATVENGKVKNGKYALGVELDYTHSGNFGQWSYNMFFNVEGQTVLRDVANGLNATRLGMWIYIPEELAPGHNLAMQTELYCGSSSTNYARKNTHLVLECNGKTLTQCSEADIPEDRWVYCYMDLTPYNYVSLQNPYSALSTRREPQFIRFYTQSKEPFNAVFYFDDITLDYSNAVDDRNAPIISDAQVSVSGTTIRSFTAKIADYSASNASGLNYASAKIYVDGVALEGVVAAGTTISSPDVTLAPGNHTVTFEIADNLGNIVKKSQDFKVEGSAPVTIEGRNDLNNVPQYDSVYYVDIKANNAENINTLTTEIYLNFANTWELDHMIVAEGFDAEYVVDRYSNIATITVTKTGNTETGAATLVSIPVRVWSWDAEAAGCESSAIGANSYPLVYIKADVRKGVVAFADGSVGTFNGNLNVSTALLSSVAPSDWHVHTEEAIADKAATCTENGYIGRTYCAVCGSVIEWGTSVSATGHDWKFNAEGKLACANGGELFNGVFTDGKTYIEGVVAADGWFEIDGVKTYYFANGVKLTGSHLIDGVMCTFDANGVYDASFKYEGFYEINDTVMYFIANTYLTGYQKLNGEFYYFTAEGLGFDGEIELCGYTCLFDDGQVVENDVIKNAGLYGENIEFVLTTDGKLTVGGSGDMAKAARVGSMPWYEANRFDVRSIVIGKDITSINNVAFYNLYYLSSVTFEKGSKLQTINASAFGLAPYLKEITLPEGLITLNASVFYQCDNLEKVVLPYSVASIASNAFEKCGKVELYVADNSYALKYAKDYGMTYHVQRGVVAQGVTGDVYWTLYTDGEFVVSGEGAMADYASGGTPWWNQRTMIKKVTIGSGVTRIGKFAFMMCSRLTEVAYEDGTTLDAIGWGAFGSCTALKTITIPATVTVLEHYAFYNSTALETVIMGEKDALQTIGMYAFWNDTALKTVYLPDGVYSFGEGAFYNAGNVVLSVQDGSAAHEYAMANKLGMSVRPAPARVLASGTCGVSAGWEFWSDGVLKITGSGAMADYAVKGAPWEQYRMRVTTVEIGKDITYIGKFAFMMCNRLTTIIFEEGTVLDTIGWGAFGYCTALKTVTIPATVKTLDAYAFYDCSALETVIMGEKDSLKSIGMYAFWNDTALKTIFLPDGVDVFGEGAFYNAGKVVLSVQDGSAAHEYVMANKLALSVRPAPPRILASGTCGATAGWEFWSNGVLKITGSGAMADYEVKGAPWEQYRMRVTTVEIGKDITYVGKFAFMMCSRLTDIVFEEGTVLETIGWGAFGYCSALKTVTIPATVKTLDAYAFYYCTALETVIMGATDALKNIGMYAFWNDTALKSIILPDSTSAFGEGAFYNAGKVVLSVQDGSAAHEYVMANKLALSVRPAPPRILASGTCGTTAGWEFWSNGVLKITGSGAMADYAVKGAPWEQYRMRVTSVEISKDITYVGKFAFMMHNKLATVVFEEGTVLETIGWGAFGYCTALKSITVPATVTILDAYAFYESTALKEVIFEKGSKLQSIGMYAFWNDTSLTVVDGMPAATKLGEGAFYNSGFQG